jgi:hypothetical protein
MASKLDQAARSSWRCEGELTTVAGYKHFWIARCVAMVIVLAVEDLDIAIWWSDSERTASILLGQAWARLICLISAVWSKHFSEDLATSSYHDH